jgi:hypothetical protein
MMVKNKQTASLAMTLVLFALNGQVVLAQGGLGGMYGGQPPGAQGVVEDEKFPGDKPGGSKPGGDYTEDEKRMQKKYKARIAHDKDLIARGEHMMKSDPKGKDYKKGKVWKEIAEKDLAELEANNPFPKPEKQDKPSKAKADTEKKEL